MNKKEIRIIEDNYYELLVVNRNLWNKEDSIRDYKRLMIALGLEKNMVDIEYKFYFDYSDLSFMQIEGYKRLREIISKYSDFLVDYNSIIEYTYNLEYEFTEEHKKNAYACIKMIEGE